MKKDLIVITSGKFHIDRFFNDIKDNYAKTYFITDYIERYNLLIFPLNMLLPIAILNSKIARFANLLKFLKLTRWSRNIIFSNEVLIEKIAEYFLKNYKLNKINTDIFLRSGIYIKEDIIKNFDNIIIFHGSKGIKSNSKLHQRKIIKTIRWNKDKTFALLTNNQSDEFKKIRGAKNFNFIAIQPNIKKIDFKKQTKFKKIKNSILIGNPKKIKGIDFFIDFIENNKLIFKEINLTIIDIFDDKKIKKYFQGFENVNIVSKKNWSELQDLYNNNTYLYHYSKYDGFAMMCMESFLCNCIPIISGQTMVKELLPRDKVIIPKSNKELQNILRNICEQNIDPLTFQTDINFRKMFEINYRKEIRLKYSNFLNKKLKS